MTDATVQVEGLAAKAVSDLDLEEAKEASQDMLKAHEFCANLPDEATNTFIALSIIGILASYKIPHDEGTALLSRLADIYPTVDLDAMEQDEE